MIFGPMMFLDLLKSPSFKGSCSTSVPP